MAPHSSMVWAPVEWATHPAPAAITAARPAPMQSAAIRAPSVEKLLKSPTNVAHVSQHRERTRRKFCLICSNLLGVQWDT